MKLLSYIPYFFDELSSEEIVLLDSYIENELIVEFKDYIDRAFKKLEDHIPEESELNNVQRVFHFNLTLESMKRRGLVSVSERIYLLDRNTRAIEISLGPVFKG